MNPIFFFFLLILVPFGAAVIVLVPMHIAFFIACYMIYNQVNEVGPILMHQYDFFFMFGTYFKLLLYWSEHTSTMPFLTHTLPVVVIPGITFLISTYLCYRFLRFMKEHFEQ